MAPKTHRCVSISPSNHLMICSCFCGEGFMGEIEAIAIVIIDGQCDLMIIKFKDEFRADKVFCSHPQIFSPAPFSLFPTNRLVWLRLLKLTAKFHADHLLFISTLFPLCE